jgi:hypothetical protein
LSPKNSNKKFYSKFHRNRCQLLDLKTAKGDSNSKMKTNKFMKKSSLINAMTGTAIK